jgi:tRNA(fMet)-specific endonuclease VapC
MSGYLLDTDICSHQFRGSRPVTGYTANHPDELHVSTVTLAELLTWTLRTNAAPKWHRMLLRFLDAAEVLPVTPEIAERCGQVRAKMFDEGHVVPIADMLIAATALVYDLTLVTHNVKHFVAIPGLKIVDWANE